MCRTSRSYRAPATRDRPDVRASQAERDRTVDELRDHAAAGRLGMDELEQRVERALRATTRGDLAVLVRDLPALRRERSRGNAVARGLKLSAATSAAIPLVFAIAVIVLAPPAFAWIGWTALGWWFFFGLPAAGAGFGLASCASRRNRRRHGRAAAA